MNISKEEVVKIYPRLNYRGILILILICGLNITVFSQSPDEIIKYSTPICQKGDYVFNEMPTDAIVFQQEIESCIPKDKGIPNEKLLSWTVSHPGILTFVIESLKSEDDIDFELFRVGNDGLQVVRCMASGPQIGRPAALNSICLGITGLHSAEFRVQENKGCHADKTNFAAPIYVSKGDSYLLRIFNFSSNRGFGFTIDGSAELSQEYTTIDIVTEQVEDSKDWLFSIPGSSSQQYDEIHWDFGDNAYPPAAAGVSSAKINYLSAGEKQILLKLSLNACHFQQQRQLNITQGDVYEDFEPALLAQPNPFKSATNLTLIASTTEETAQVKVFAADGTLVHQSTVGIFGYESNIDLFAKSWPSGRYTAVVTLGDVEVKTSLIKI